VPDMAGMASSGMSKSLKQPKQPSQEGLSEILGGYWGKKK